MEPKSPESFKPIEISPKLDQNLKTLLDTSFNEVLGGLSGSNDTNDKKYQSYMSKIYKLESSILETEDDESAPPFSVFEEKLDNQSNSYSIVLVPSSKIIRTNGYSKPIIDLIAGPVDRCEISIKSFYDYKKDKHNPSDSLLNSGYEIDFSYRKASLENGNFHLSNKFAGLGIKVFLDGSAVSFLKTYVGGENFKNTNQFEINSRSTKETLKYLSTLGLPNPNKI